jgi:hypothetical protein
MRLRASATVIAADVRAGDTSDPLGLHAVEARTMANKNGRTARGSIVGTFIRKLAGSGYGQVARLMRAGEIYRDEYLAQPSRASP